MQASTIGWGGRFCADVQRTTGITEPRVAEERTRCGRRMPRHISGLLALALAASLAARQVAAEELGSAEPEESKQSEWSFQVVPYFWLPAVEGTVSTRGQSAEVDVGFDKIFDLLGAGDLLGGMGHFEAKYRRFSLFVDAIGGTARPTNQVALGPRQMATAKADLTMNFTYVEFGPAYRVLDLPVGDAGSSIALDLLAGGRFMYFYQSIGLKGSGGRVSATATATTTWVDPFVGGRWSVPLVGDLGLFFRGDIGGFSAGSELAWNLVGGLQYELPWRPGSARTSVILAYKAFDFDYQTGSGDEATAIALNQRGPGIGFGFEF